MFGGDHYRLLAREPAAQVRRKAAPRMVATVDRVLPNIRLIRGEQASATRHRKVGRDRIDFSLVLSSAMPYCPAALSRSVRGGTVSDGGILTERPNLTA